MSGFVGAVAALLFVWQYALRPLHPNKGLTFAALLGFGLPAIAAASCLFFLAAERPFLNAPRALGGSNGE